MYSHPDFSLQPFHAVNYLDAYEVASLLLTLKEMVDNNFGWHAVESIMKHARHCALLRAVFVESLAEMKKSLDKEFAKDKALCNDMKENLMIVIGAWVNELMNKGGSFISYQKSATATCIFCCCFVANCDTCRDCCINLPVAFFEILMLLLFQLSLSMIFVL